MADSVSKGSAGYDHDNLRHVVITSTCFAFILSTVAVGLRIIPRKVNGTGLYLDDFLMLGALVGLCYENFQLSFIDWYSYSNMEYRLQELFVGPFQLNESPDQSINIRVVLYNGLGTHIVYLKPEQITVYLKVRLEILKSIQSIKRTFF